jgi:acid phosphatase (class A)
MIGQSYRWALSRVLPAVVGMAMIIGCAANRQGTLDRVPEIKPGLLAGYLKPEVLPNSLKLLPPPPAAGSAALALDVEASLAALDLQGSPRWKLAAADAQLSFPEAAGAFSCALGVPITQKDTPQLFRLLRRTLTDAGLSTYAAKNHYQRTRPFMVNKESTCTPKEEGQLKTDGSYPSGHTAIGWAWALILSEIAPERTDALLARGRAFGESRIVCNVHWYSDVVAGRMVGAAAVARLHADAGFRSAVSAAMEEVADLRERGLIPTADCAAEADALAH